MKLSINYLMAGTLENLVKLEQKKVEFDFFLYIVVTTNFLDSNP